MFVRFADKKGRDVWVNPLHVKVVAPAGNDMSDLYFTYGPWGTGNYIRVRQSPTESTLALDAAMPPISFIPDSSDETQLQHNAATNTTVIT